MTARLEEARARLSRLREELAGGDVGDALREGLIDDAVERIVARHRERNDPQRAARDRLTRVLAARRAQRLAAPEVTTDLDIASSSLASIERYIAVAPGWAQDSELPSAEAEREILRAVRAAGDADAAKAAGDLVAAAVEHDAKSAVLAAGPAVASAETLDLAHDDAFDAAVTFFASRLARARADRPAARALAVGNDVLRAVLDAPDDDGPRLVYADWLSENGTDPERGEYVVLACSLARDRFESVIHPDRRRRAEALLRKNQARWIAELGVPGLDRVRFERGFVEHVEAGPSFVRTWLGHLVARTPLRSLAIAGASSTRPEVLAEVLSLPAAARLRRLALPGAQIDRGAAGALFGAAAKMPALRRLDLPNALFLHSGALVMSELAPTAIEELDLSNVTVQGDAELLGRVFASPALSALRSLWTQRDHGHVAATAASRGTWPALRALHVGDAKAPSVRALASADLALEELTLAPVSDADLAALAAARWAPRLRTLSVAGPASPQPALAGRGLAELLSQTRSLEELHVTGFVLGATDLRAAAASESLRSLRRHDLSECLLDDAGARALAESPHLSNVVEVRVVGAWTRMSTMTSDALVRRFPHVVLHC